MTDDERIADGLVALDSLEVAVLTDDVSDNYVSKTPFAVSEFSNVVKRGASVISGEALLCANLDCWTVTSTTAGRSLGSRRSRRAGTITSAESTRKRPGSRTRCCWTNACSWQGCVAWA